MSASPPPPPPSNPTHRPRVGVGVFVLRRSTPTPEFIMGLRKGSHGADTWALPGGHLEQNETFEACATREVQEETGLRVTRVRFLTATNDVMAAEDRHYVTVFVVAEVDDRDGPTEPRLCEPDKCAAWEWVRWEDLVGWVESRGEARRLFLPLVNLVQTRPGVVPVLL